MTDLIGRLRQPVMLHSNPEQTNAERYEAADEIEKLETETLNQQIVIGELRKGWEAKEAEIDERLRAALEFYANRDNYVLEGEGSAIDADDGEIARKALEGK